MTDHDLLIVIGERVESIKADTVELKEHLVLHNSVLRNHESDIARHKGYFKAIWIILGASGGGGGVYVLIQKILGG